MSRDASISLPWADGEYTFRLAIGQLSELQEKCDAGPAWIYARLESDTWRHYDILETIRLGLIGGGQTPDKARALVKEYVQNRPLLENVVPAMKVLAAALVGAPDEQIKKGEGEGMTSSLSPMESSGSAISTDAELS